MKKNISCFTIGLFLITNAISAQDNWNNQNSATSPSPQYGHSISYIGDDKVVVFTGGGAETWIYDLSDNIWTNKNPASHPSARWTSAMAYLGGDQVLLYGGTEDIFGNPLIGTNETWIYDLSDNLWTLKNPSSNPGLRFYHALASAGGDQVLLFGGDGSPNDTWVYDLSDNTWTSKYPAAAPSGGQGVGMSSIGSDKVTLFGGSTSPDQTWVYDLSDNAWTEKFPVTKPGMRSGTGMAYLGGDQVLLFGGLNLDIQNPNPNYDDTWVYDLGDNTWIQKTPANYPSARSGHAMAPISSNKILMSGGDFFTHDTWLYTATAPACSMTASAGADEHLLFGYGPSQCKTKTAVVNDGTSPFIYSWTLDRALLTGETMTGANAASVTICLMNNAELCLTVTDAASCTATDCATIFAEDVRCFSGNNQKVSICHNGNTICVEESAVPAHLAHGDYQGACTTSFTGIEDDKIKLDGDPVFNVFPNPSNGNFTVTVNLNNEIKNAGIIRVVNMNGQLVKELNLSEKNRLDMKMDEPGIYQIQLITTTQVITKKLVIVN